jgi:DNA-binding CsgD family transcriptional regulator
LGNAQITELTPREREILTLIAEGDSLAEIAHKLSRSLKTVESHRLSIGRKLKASNRVELAKIAIANGLVTIEPAQASPDTSGLAERELHWLEKINDAIGDMTGKKLLERFCTAASTLPNISIAAICTPERSPDGTPKPYNRVMMAISDEGRLRKPLCYKAEKTPCQDIINQGECGYTTGIQNAYPEDTWLKEVEAESYLGVQLMNQLGEPVGGVGLIGRQGMDNIDEIRNVIEFFAPRLAGALEASIEIDMLRAQIDLLESELVEPDPDSIVATGEELTPEVKLALTLIYRRVHNLAGASFIRGIADAIADIFELSHVAICHLDQALAAQSVRSIIFLVDRQIADTATYPLSETPCAIAIEKGSYFVPNDAGKCFPKDELLLKSNIESYLGLRIPSPDGKILGLIWMGNRDPIQSPETILKVMKHFAPRIGAELSNQLQVDALRQQHEELEQELKIAKGQAHGA